MNIDEYAYLWDGTEPGWYLSRMDRVERKIIVEFPESGPTLAEEVVSKMLEVGVRVERTHKK